MKTRTETRELNTKENIS